MTSASCESTYKTVIAEKIGVLLFMSSRDRTMATVMLGDAYTLGSLRAWIERIGLVKRDIDASRPQCLAHEQSEFSS